MDLHAVLPWAQITAAIAAPVLIAWATKSSAAAATRQAHELDRQNREESESAELENVLRGIHVELVTVIRRYQQTVGWELEEAARQDTIFQGYLRAEQPYFTIYDSSARTLGRLQDRRLHASIVQTYTLLRSVIDAQAIQRGHFEETDGFTQIRDSETVLDHTRTLAAVHADMIGSARETVQQLEGYFGPVQPGQPEDFRQH